MSTMLAASLVAGYLIGSIPAAYLIAKARGVDIFEVGTGNPGTANTFRTVGRTAGMLVFITDVARGAGAVLITRAVGVEPLELQAAVGGAAIVGHWYPLFLRFRGGAGLAPAVGVALGTLPIAGSVGIVPAVLVLLWFRSTGHAAGVGFTAFLISGAVMQQLWPALVVVGIAAAVLLHSKYVQNSRAGKDRR